MSESLGWGGGVFFIASGLLDGGLSWLVGAGWFGCICMYVLIVTGLAGCLLLRHELYNPSDRTNSSNRIGLPVMGWDFPVMVPPIPPHFSRFQTPQPQQSPGQTRPGQSQAKPSKFFYFFYFKVHGGGGGSRLGWVIS